VGGRSESFRDREHFCVAFALRKQVDALLVHLKTFIGYNGTVDRFFLDMLLSQRIDPHLFSV
jgi:hypothetical protein